MMATELYDRHLHKAFIDALLHQGYIERHDDKLQPTALLFRVAEEANAMLSESTRHAIIAASRAVISQDT